MNQLLLGAVIPFTIGAAVYLLRRGRASVRFLIILPVTMALSMLWAVAPDIPRLLGMTQLYHKLSFDPRCDIFYWHYTIDMIETDSSIYLAGFAALLAMLLGAAWRELYLRERSN